MTIEVIVHRVEQASSLCQSHTEPLPFFRCDDQGREIDGPRLLGFVGVCEQIVGDACFAHNLIELVPMSVSTYGRPFGKCIEPLLPMGHDGAIRIHHFVMDAGECLVKHGGRCGWAHAVLSCVARQAGCRVRRFLQLHSVSVRSALQDRLLLLLSECLTISVSMSLQKWIYAFSICCLKIQSHSFCGLASDICS